MKTIEVCCDPNQCPTYLSRYPEFWLGQQLRAAGIPLFERSLQEGVHRGVLTRETLEGGSLRFRWTDEEAA